MEADPDDVFPGLAALWKPHDPLALYMPVMPASKFHCQLRCSLPHLDHRCGVLCVPLRLNLENHYPGQPVPAGHSLFN